MATWPEVKEYIKANYVTTEESDSLLSLQFQTGRGRTQVVFVMGIEDAGPLNCARFFSAFAKVEQISPYQLAELAKSSVFGLAETGGLYGFVHNACLADLDASEIAVPMNAVTEHADNVERQLGLGDSL